ncbi:MAG: hypothetical protein LBK71_11675 [Verrucomicrobiales bacterium]|nr:hypothetical protein [Verrucomicrobiales bacterium]
MFHRQRVFAGLIIVFIYGVLGTVSVPARAAGDDPDKLAQTIVRELRGQFSNLTGYELSATRAIWQNPELIKPLLAPPLAGKLSLALSGTRFYLHDQLAFGPAGEKNFRMAAYDGEYYQVLTTHTGYLYLKKTAQPPREYFRRYLDEYLRPLEFFSELTKDDDSQFTILADLQQAANWELFAKRISNAGYVEVAGKKMARFEVKSGIEYTTAQKSHYVVLADPDRAFFPVQWERIADETAKPIYVYRITEVGCQQLANQKIYYPARAELDFHGGVGKKAAYSNTPRSKLTINIKLLFNPSLEDEQFTLDPSMARHIWDADGQALIAVPH